MKKILTLVALAALAFTSCVKEDETYKRINPVRPGINIYDGTMTMHRLAMHPADMAVRLAIVQAEAYKQKPEAVDPDLTKVTVGDTNIFTGLLGKQVTLTQTGTVFKMEFKVDEINQYYMSKGTMEIETNGKSLEQSSSASPWVLTFASDYAVVVVSGNGYNTLLSAATTYNLYYEEGAYKINVQGFKANVKDSAIKSNWNDELTLTPPAGGTSLAYSDIKGKRFGVQAEASGVSCVTFDGKTGAELSLRISNGLVDNYLSTVGGTAICKLTGTNDYNASYYKATEALVEWSLNESNKLKILLTYNGITENVTGYIR